VPTHPSVPNRVNRSTVSAYAAGMVTAYLTKWRAGLPALHAALERSEFESMRVSGHHLKGTGGAYGFPALSAIGASIEHAALDKSASDLKRQLAALESYSCAIEIISD